ncbi:ThiF family adenylyltransferase [cf. Phormidesmis sp. LEGE 11477]|nr:ThiF family adenylyltransferase [cf. Phormidesmis sp. LEGE 11477]
MHKILFPTDGKEAVAIALCSRRTGEHHRLLVREVHAVGPEFYSYRSEDQISWSTDCLEPLLEKAEQDELSVVKVHSHPGGYANFSEIDDDSDHRLMPAIRGWVEADVPHVTAVMLPDGQMFGRVLWRGEDFEPLACVAVIGADLKFWYDNSSATPVGDFTASHAQAFGQGTTERLRRLSVAVVGCSGTGSPVVEQLVRLGVGEIVLVDDDHIEERNVNRILNSTTLDAQQQMSKAQMLADSINKIGLGTQVRVFSKNLRDRDAMRAVAECDVVFGCMDSLEGRFLLNTLATYYTLPYFDLGVRLDAVPEGEARGEIREVCGTVHYLQPGLSSLMSRGLVDMNEVQAEGLQRTDPEAYGQQVKDGYISGIEEHRPAVISVNMLLASLAVNDFLARLHPYREEPNSTIASIAVSLSSLEIFVDPEEEPCPMLQAFVGHGDCSPLLGLMELME